MHARRGPLPALAAAALLACAPDPAVSPGLALLRFRQAGRTGVALNEELVFLFSAELDRASVTRESVRIVDPQGMPVAGRFAQRRSTLVFRPDLPRRPDLSDGGLVPGTVYAVELLGFPRPDGLRALEGSLLEGSMRFEFRTAGASAEGDEGAGGEGRAPLFADPFLGEPTWLEPVSVRIGPFDPIALSCREALDPRSLDPDQFVLRTVRGGRLVPEPELLVELAENRRDHALLLLRPFSAGSALGGLRALEPGEYFLHLASDAPVTNLGGRPVPHSWGPRPLGIVVRDAGEVRVESFEDTAYRGREPVEGADGTALWSGDGSVSVRFPAAAGSGLDGPVQGPRDAADPSDVHATRLTVPAGEVWDLSAEPGLVVLRSQGALEVAGRLVRGGAEDAPPIGDTLRGPDRRLLADAGPLTAWLSRARGLDHPWTVLVAGGDLRVEGSVEIDGPLLLVAGGWIRISGRVEAGEAWKSPEGGENVVAPDSVRVAPFTWDAPHTNPLVEPLRYAVLSSPYRPEGGVLSWEQAVVRGEPGDGSYRVRFLGLRDYGQESLLFGPLDDPGQLADCPAVRFLVELEVDPSEGAWSPPRVDEIELHWIPAPARPEER